MKMLNSVLAKFYERDLRRLVAEVVDFRDEANLWKVHGSVKNPAGNLVLHIIGGSRYLIGATLAQTGYVRNRDLEFTRKGVPREELVTELEGLIPMISQTILKLGEEGLDADYPRPFDGMVVTNGYLLIQLLAHLNYHLGQVNYLRRSLE